jgi:hypothetical protein
MSWLIFGILTKVRLEEESDSIASQENHVFVGESERCPVGEEGTNHPVVFFVSGYLYSLLPTFFL